MKFCQNQRLQEVRQQEEELLMREEESARQYLTYTVMPVLSQGLVELCRIRPNDAIDFLVGLLTLSGCFHIPYVYVVRVMFKNL